MAENKNSFILYSDSKEVIEALTDDQAGKLLKHIFKYVNDEDPACDDPYVNLAFIPIKQSLKRDLKKWENKQDQRRAAGKRSAEVRRQNATTVNGRSISSTVSGNGNGNGNGSVNDNNNITLSAEDKSSTKNLEKKVTDFDLWIQDLAKWFYNTIEKKAKDKLTEKQVLKWLDTFDKCVKIDKYTSSEVEKITKWARTDSFWKSNFQTPVKLRKKQDDVMYISIFNEKMNSRNKPTHSSNRTDKLIENTKEAARMLGLTNE